MAKAPEVFFKADELETSMRTAFADHAPNPKKMLLLAVPVKDPEQRPAVVPKNLDRGRIIFVNDRNDFDWEVTSLASLFRGDKQPPHLGAYPEAYEGCFLRMDMQFLQLCESWFHCSTPTRMRFSSPQKKYRAKIRPENWPDCLLVTYADGQVGSSFQSAQEKSNFARGNRQFTG